MTEKKRIGLKRFLCVGLALAVIFTSMLILTDNNTYAATSFSAKRVLNVTLTQPKSYKEVKVKWDPVVDATGYEVYRAKAQYGKYYFRYKTKYTSYTNQGLTLGSSYYYKVRAYKFVKGKKYYSKSSYIKGIKTAYVTPTFKIETYGCGQYMGIIITNNKYSKDLRVYINDADYYNALSDEIYGLKDISWSYIDSDYYHQVSNYLTVPPGKSRIINTTISGYGYYYDNTAEYFATHIKYRNVDYSLFGNTQDKVIKRI